MEYRYALSGLLVVLAFIISVGVVGLGWGPPPGYCSKPTTHNIGYTAQVVWPACPDGTAPGLEIMFNGQDVVAGAKCVQIGGGNPPWIWPTSQLYMMYNVTIEIQELGWTTTKAFDNTQPTQLLFIFIGSNNPHPMPNTPYTVRIFGQTNVYPLCKNNTGDSGSGGDDSGSTGKIPALVAGAGVCLILVFMLMLRGDRR